MAKIPSFGVFKKEIFNNLDEDEKSILFYWSLMDSATWWEETPKPSYYPEFSEGKKKVLSILKKSRIISNEYIKSDEEKFFNKFVELERLTNYLLTAEIENPIKNIMGGSIDTNALPKTIFPDVVIQETKFGIINIEIKGKLSASNLKDRIEKEILPRIEDEINYKNFLLLLIFPLCPKDEPERINQFVEGFYTYESLMKRRTLNRKVLCQCVSENYINKYSLDKLGNRIIEVINNDFK